MEDEEETMENEEKERRKEEKVGISAYVFFSFLYSSLHKLNCNELI